MGLTGNDLILIPVAFLVSMFNASVGPSGGITLATMATILPPPVVVPIHAVTEAASSAIRTLVLRDFVDWHFFTLFALGGLIGFALGMPVVQWISTSTDFLTILLGAFILISAWVPLSALAPQRKAFAAGSGAVTSFLTLLVGATGPLVCAVVGQNYSDHRKVIGTSAGCMFYQHVVKIPIFGLLGFSYALYMPLIINLVAATIAGTWVGYHILIRVKADLIKVAFKFIISLLGAKLLFEGIYHSLW